MSHCINTSHPDYQDLLLQTKLTPGVLKAKIATWMDNNTADKFPTVADILDAEENILYNIEKETHASAKAKILKKVNANKEGYVSPFRYPELLTLVGMYNRSQPKKSLELLKAASGNYYINVIGTALQLTSKTNEQPIKDLENKLRSWAKTHGIAIEAMEDLMQRFDGRYKDGALGLADFTKQLIGLVTENESLEQIFKIGGVEIKL